MHLKFKIENQLHLLIYLPHELMMMSMMQVGYKDKQLVLKQHTQTHVWDQI